MLKPRLLLLTLLWASLATVSKAGEVSPSSGTIGWAQWNSNSSATLAAGGTSVGVAFSGENDQGLLQWNVWNPSSSFADGVAVKNAPSGVDGVVRLIGGSSSRIDTLTFSVPVIDPVISIWSLGQLNSKAVFVFNDAKPTLVASGPNGMFGGGTLTVLGNEVWGSEGNGTIQFHGIFSSLSWTNPVAENWYGITVGAADAVAAVPEPESHALMLGGLGVLGLLARRRRVER